MMCSRSWRRKKEEKKQTHLQDSVTENNIMNISHGALYWLSSVMVFVPWQLQNRTKVRLNGDMRSFIRTLVSKSKRRYTENGFNLDLTCNNNLHAYLQLLQFSETCKSWQFQSCGMMFTCLCRRYNTEVDSYGLPSWRHGEHISQSHVWSAAFSQHFSSQSLQDHQLVSRYNSTPSKHNFYLLTGFP